MVSRTARVPSSVVKNLLVLLKQNLALTQLNSQRLHLQNVRSTLPLLAHRGPVVSITTYGTRLKTVYLVLESIASGSVLPSRLILWVDDPQVFRTPPAPLRRLVRRGLEICLTEDYGPHKKYYPYVASAASFDHPLVTADDDVFYSRWWLAGLVSAHNQNPDVVNCYRANVVRFTDRLLQPYPAWRPCDSTEPSLSHFPLGNSGCIYPAPFLRILKHAGDAFFQSCPRGDDIWLHANAIRAGFKVRQIQQQPVNFPCVPGTQHNGLSRVKAERIDEQIRKTYTTQDIALLVSASEGNPVQSAPCLLELSLVPPASGGSFGTAKDEASRLDRDSETELNANARNRIPVTQWSRTRWGAKAQPIDSHF